ncbi:MAG: DUF92 domain-containing protein [Roseburia sp.]|nr:DUF92 domain-containing protein [Roseburia sp.]
MNKTLFTIIGYVVFIGYTCGIMGLGTLIEKKTKIDKTVCRKLTHIFSALIWIICYFFFGCSIHWVILNGVGAVALGVVVFGNLMDTYERDDAKKSYGLFFIGFATFITALISFLLGKETYLYTGIAYYCLALGDGLAPLVAKLLKKHNPKIMEGRTLFGSLTVFIISFLCTLAFSLIFGMELSPLFMLSVAGLTTSAEFYGLKGLDNLFIDFSVFGYLLLYHYGYVSTVLQVVLLVTPFIAFLAIGTKSLTVSGGIFGLLLFYLVGFFGRGAVPVLFVVIMFTVGTVVSFITSRLYNRRAGVTPVKHGRTGKQIAAVGLAAVICLIVYYFTDITLFYALYFLSITEQFADSMASDIGRLTKGKNVDIIRFKAVEKGLSGGISLLGTACALLGSVVLALVPFLFRIIEINYFLVLAAIAFAGTLIDSVLGSLCQALYECGTCGALTENKTHCNANTRLVKGVSWIDNTAVNFLTSFLTCGVGCLMLLL